MKMQSEGSKKNSKKQIYGCLLIALAAFCYSWQSPITKLLLAEGVRALDVVTGLSLCSAVLIDGYFLATRKARGIVQEVRENISVVFLQGLAKFGINFGLFLALRTMNAGVLSVVYYTAPAFVCVFFMITKIKPVGAANKIAVLTTVAGCMLALDVFHVSFAELSIPGILLGLLAAVSCGTFTVLTDLKGRELSFHAITAGALTINAVLAVLVNPGIFIRIPSFSLLVAGLFLCQAVVTKIMSIVTETRGVMHIGAEKATVILALEVPFTLLISYLTLHETMTGIQLTGVALVICSVLLLQREN